MDANQTPPRASRGVASWTVVVGATLAVIALVVLTNGSTPSQPSPYQQVAQDMRALRVSIPGLAGSETDLVTAVDGICAWTGTRTDLVKVGRYHQMSTTEVQGLIDSSVRNVCPEKVFTPR